MTYEEREKAICNNCEAKENCSYISRNLERKCSFKETTMYGWELGYKDAVNKAYRWLLEQMFELDKDGEIYVADGDASSIKEKMDDAFTKMMLKGQVDGFDAELNVLLKKYEHLPKEEILGCLNFYVLILGKEMEEQQ